MELLGRVRWTNEDPAIYANIYYEHQRNGADMKYRVKISIEPVTGYSYYGYAIYSQVSMDGSQKASTTLKNSSPSQWSSNIEWTTDWYTISNKTTGTTSLAVRINSNDGVRDATYTYSMAVDPAHFTQTPKVEYQSATTTSATFKWTTSENASTVKYILDGGSEVSCFSGNAATGTFTITELTSNTSHTLKINAQRKDSGLWSYSEQISFNTSNKTVRIRVNNVWEDATPYIRVNGEWEQTTPYIRINNEWKRGK